MLGSTSVGAPAADRDTVTGGSPSEVASTIVFAACRTAATVALVAASWIGIAGAVTGVVKLFWSVVGALVAGRDFRGRFITLAFMVRRDGG